jgi:hypothetical protein
VTSAEAHVSRSAQGGDFSCGSKVEDSNVWRVIWQVPGNAAVDFTASVILIMLLSHWFIQGIIRQVS